MKAIHAAVFFYVVTNMQRWGRGADLSDAFKAAGSKPDAQQHEFHVNIMLFQKDTPKEIIQNIGNCFTVNDWGQVTQCDGLGKEDLKQIKEYLLGWAYYSNTEKYLTYVAKKKKAALKVS